jgi:hypothetical protein
MLLTETIHRGVLALACDRPIFLAGTVPLTLRVCDADHRPYAQVRSPKNQLYRRKRCPVHALAQRRQLPINVLADCTALR